MVDLRTVLRVELPDPKWSTRSSSTSQSDHERGTHPAQVQFWTDFAVQLDNHIASLPVTKRRFIIPPDRPDPVCDCSNTDTLLLLDTAVASLCFLLTPQILPGGKPLQLCYACAGLSQGRACQPVMGPLH